MSSSVVCEESWLSIPTMFHGSVVVVVVALATVGLCQDDSFIVPYDDCTWRGDMLSSMNSCEGNEIMVGGCGSGGGARDCTSEFTNMVHKAWSP